jgi:hypothetical protein
MKFYELFEISKSEFWLLVDYGYFYTKKQTNEQTDI